MPQMVSRISFQHERKNVCVRVRYFLFILSIDNPTIQRVVFNNPFPR